MKLYNRLWRNVDRKMGKRNKGHISFAIVRTDLIDNITAAGAVKATIYDKMAEA